MSFYAEYDHCELCPRKCGAARNAGQKGYCGQTAALKVGLAMLHHWEEPCISGEKGAGTVFFAGCSLRCEFCQNSALNEQEAGVSLDAASLAETFLSLEARGAENIELVTAGHFLPQVREALILAKEKGLKLPVVYNTGGYETVESLKTLRGLIDIYMPDMKYLKSETAERYSKAPDYPQVASAAIAEMYEQTGPLVWEGPKLKKGVLVRHLVMPGHSLESVHLVEQLKNTYGDRILLSVMSQYTPLGAHPEHPELERRITRKEYDRVVEVLLRYPDDNSYIQDRKVAEESFIPSFDGSGLVLPEGPLKGKTTNE